MVPADSSEKKALRYSVIDAAFYSIMVGLGETYMPAYILALGFGQLSSGFIAIIPVFIGSALQLVAMRGLSFLQSHKKMVLICGTLQAVTLLGISTLSLWSHLSLIVVFVLSSIYWAAGLTAGPSWNAWISSTVPKKIRLDFFSYRSRIANCFVCLGLVVGGVILAKLGKMTSAPWIFSAILLIAALARFGSVFFLSLQPENKFNEPLKAMPILAIIKWLMSGHVKYIVLFQFVAQLCVQISAPFFNPYMLSILNLNYDEYMILLAVALLARVLFYGLYPTLLKGNGVRFLVLFGAIGIIPLPYLWSLADSYAFLVGIQILAGCTWGAFELGIMLYLLETQEPNNRARILAVNNFLNSSAMLIGCIVGGIALRNYSLSQQGYEWLFTWSSVVRIIPLIFLPGFLNQPIEPKRFFLRIVGVRSNAGPMVKPILYPDETGPIRKQV